MTDPGRPADGAGTDREPPLIPEQTSDDTDVGWGERDRGDGWSADDDERFLRERPPHWE